MVRPQLILLFLPMITPGMPAKLKPLTSNGQASETTRQCSPTWVNTDGIEVARCGSLPRIGLPVAVLEPAITQEFEPTSEPSPSGATNSGIPAAAASTARKAGTAARDCSSVSAAEATVAGRA